MLASFFHPTGYLGIFLFIASTGCGMPIPEEAAIVVAGVLSAQGRLHTWLAFAVCLAGAVVGDTFMYAIGYRWGHSIFTKHPRFAKLFATENEKQFQGAVETHALKVMLIARFLVGIRAPVYVMTGVVRLPFRRFLLYDVISATLVVGLVLIAVAAILYYRHPEHVINLLFGSETPPAES